MSGAGDGVDDAGGEGVAGVAPGDAEGEGAVGDAARGRAAGDADGGGAAGDPPGDRMAGVKQVMLRLMVPLVMPMVRVLPVI